MRLASPSPILALVLFCMSACAFAQAGRWEYIDGVKGAYTIMGKHRDDGTVFLGTSGGLYVLDPGSDRWRQMSNGLPHSLVASIAFGKPREIVVAVDQPSPSIYRSTDDGESWSLLVKPTLDSRGMFIGAQFYYDALACDPISGDISVGSTTAVYRLRAGETGWKIISHVRQTKQFYYVDGVLYFNYGNLYACGPNDSMVSVVGTPFTTSSIATFAIAPGGAFYAVTSPLALLRSTDKGLTWSTINAAPPDTFSWMSFISDNSIIAGYAGRTPFRSDDGGVTWTSANITVDSGLTTIPDFVVAGPDVVVAAGGNATSRSLDDARTFRDNTDGLRSRYARAIAARIGTPLYISYELGKTHRYTPSPPVLVDLKADFALTTVADDGTIYGVPANATSVSRSTDDGATWKVVGGDASIASITSINTARGRVYVGTTQRGTPARYAVWNSDNRGDTWRRTGGNLAASAFKLAVDSLGRIYAGSDAGIYRSIDNSASFGTLAGSAKARALAVSPDNTVYAAKGGTLWRLPNDSTTWELAYSFTPYFDARAIAVDTAGVVYVSSSDGGIAHSEDGGISFAEWSDETLSSIWDFAIAGDATLYAMNAYTGVVRFKLNEPEPEPPDTTTDELPIGIYPVPVTDQATIAFRTSEETHVCIDVFDVLGQRVADLADQVYPKGRNVVMWDALGYASTAYFIRVAIGDDVSVTKVIVIR